MRVVHYIYDHILNPWVGGGGAVRVREVYRRFSDAHEITVVCGLYPGAEDYREANVRFRFVGTGRNNYVLSTLHYAVSAARHAMTNAGRYDVVVEDFAPYNPVFTFLWQRESVIQLHQREGLIHLKKYAILGIPFFFIEKYYPRFFKNAVPESALGKEKFGLRGRIRIIPNGFHPDLIRLNPEEGDYILFLGRIHIGQKGLDTLAEAFDRVNQRLIIAGGGKDEGRTKALFSSLIERGIVEFIGRVEGRQKEELLRRALFVVMPSRYEGQPVTVFEAAACGKPVIVSDITEFSHAVEAGFAIPFRSGDAEDLALKIRMLLENREERREMGRRARAYAERFTWDSVADEYEAYLLDVAEETAAGKR
jgi:glycosyltransferase involved in cell wall biosynthesis